MKETEMLRCSFALRTLGQKNMLKMKHALIYHTFVTSTWSDQSVLMLSRQLLLVYFFIVRETL